MAGKSTGQLLGTIAGAIIGGLTGGTGYLALGASLGGMVGGLIDPPDGPKGPRLDDLRVQTSAYGLPIPYVRGRTQVSGNVFWVENNQLKEVEEEQGGKGGGGGGMTVYEYYATFAVGICGNEIVGVQSITLGADLFYSADANDSASLIASNRSAEYFTLYRGTADQMPDDRMQADLGVDGCPAFRGFSYIVFKDLHLKKYGNSIAGVQARMEVVADDGTVTTHTFQVTTEVNGASGFTANPWRITAEYTEFIDPAWDSTYPATSSYRLRRQHHDGTRTDGVIVECSGLDPLPAQNMTTRGAPLVSALEVFNQRLFTAGSGFIHECNLVYAGISTYNETDDAVRTLYLSFGDPEDSHTLTAQSDDLCVCTDGEYFYVIGATSTRKYNLVFTLIASGPGAGSYGQFPASRAIIVNGLLHMVESPGNSVALLRWSDDLQTRTVVRTDVSFVTDSLKPNGDNWICGMEGDAIFVGSCRRYTTGTYPLINHDRFQHAVFGDGFTSSDTLPLSAVVSGLSLKTSVLTTGDLHVSQLDDDIVNGVSFNNVTSLRDALDMLRKAWPFDIIESDYKLKFVRRGRNPSARTIHAEDMGATLGGSDPGVIISDTIDQSMQMPRRVVVNYLDRVNAYEDGSQYAERLNTNEANTLTVALPLALDTNEAAGMAAALLYAAWTERRTFSFSVGPEHNDIEPADVLTIEVGGNLADVRVEKINSAVEGTRDVDAVLNRAAVYSPALAGVAPIYVAPSVRLPGPNTYMLLDIPTLADAYDGPGIGVAMRGQVANWPGGGVYRSSDNGNTWAEVAHFQRPCFISPAENALSVPLDPRLIDARSRLQVSQSGGSLYSVTHQQMLNGMNWFAYGVHGRWEIIAARVVEADANGNYTLSNMLRGRCGTEWAMGLHQVSDWVIHLDQNTVQAVGMSINHLDMEMVYRGISSGNSIGSDISLPFTYQGTNLECLSPVYLSGSRDSTGNWTLGWIRRTRVGGEWRSFSDASLGEASESYDVEIYDGSGYATVKRTFTGLTSATLTYSDIQQNTDFSGLQSTLYVKVYQNSANRGRGIPLVANITRPRVGVLVAMLLHFDGAEGSINFVDETGYNTITGSVGNSDCRAASSYFGTGRGLFISTWYPISFYPASAMNPGSSDFTWEAFVRITADGYAQKIFTMQPAAGNQGLVLSRTSANRFRFQAGDSDPATWNVDLETTSAFTGNPTWRHVAFVRHGLNFYIYVAGNRAASFTVGANFTIAFSSSALAAFSESGMASLTLDEVRFTKGLAHYTGATYTVPTAPFTL